jgi:hypothetical protein
MSWLREKMGSDAAFVAGLPFDFWAQILQAHPQWEVQVAGDLIAERGDDAVCLVALLEHHFGLQVNWARGPAARKEDISEIVRYMRLTPDEPVLSWVQESRLLWSQEPEHEPLPAALNCLGRSFRKHLPELISLGVCRTPSILAELASGTRFRYSDPDLVWEVLGHLLPNVTAARKVRGDGSLGGYPVFFLPDIPVFPVSIPSSD